MNVRRLSMTVIATGALALASALPAAAHPSHGSCKGFGAFFADWAQGGYEAADQDNPGLGPWATGPGVIAGNVALEHDLFCQ